MYSIPSNMIPFAIGVPVFLFFSWRGFSNYNRLHNPLSRYFAWSGLLAAAAFFFWSIPVIFSRNENYVLAVEIAGDVFLYSMFVLQFALLHYMVLYNKISRYVFMAPVILLAIVGMASHLYGYLHYGTSISDEAFDYTLPLISSIIQSILLVGVFLVGIILLSKLKDQKSSKSKANLVGVAALYILSGLAGLLNVLFSGTSNDSPLILTGYVAGFLLFMSVVLLAKIKPSNNLPK